MQNPGAKMVLVVEDDHDLQSLVAIVLETQGYHVETAFDGREGLELVERNLPDLILLDMKMRVMDGWEFAHEFHSRYGFKAPIVVMTAATDARKWAVEINASGWIGKPFELDALVSVVGQYAKTG